MGLQQTHAAGTDTYTLYYDLVIRSP